MENAAKLGRKGLRNLHSFSRAYYHALQRPEEIKASNPTTILFAMVCHWRDWQTEQQEKRTTQQINNIKALFDEATVCLNAAKFIDVQNSPHVVKNTIPAQDKAKKLLSDLYDKAMTALEADKLINVPPLFESAKEKQRAKSMHGMPYQGYQMLAAYKTAIQKNPELFDAIAPQSHLQNCIDIFLTVFDSGYEGRFGRYPLGIARACHDIAGIFAERRPEYFTKDMFEKFIGADLYFSRMDGVPQDFPGLRGNSRTLNKILMTNLGLVAEIWRENLPIACNAQAADCHKRKQARWTTKVIMGLLLELPLVQQKAFIHMPYFTRDDVALLGRFAWEPLPEININIEAPMPRPLTNPQSAPTL